MSWSRVKRWRRFVILKSLWVVEVGDSLKVSHESKNTSFMWDNVNFGVTYLLIHFIIVF